MAMKVVVGTHLCVYYAQPGLVCYKLDLVNEIEKLVARIYDILTLKGRNLTKLPVSKSKLLVAVKIYYWRRLIYN